ncbi:HTH-type transcriptional regulator SinR [termite gut metagenome]|uniref:HTH-type transcriptional regulator SinR n=1 Tax=termite gut metagenome TaxID=433724 RepID=A0A5J4SQP7_9ZZZZ
MTLRIKQICKEKGVSLSDVAQKTGMAQANLSSLLRRNPTVSTLSKVADALDVDISELFEQKRNEIICPHCGQRFEIIEKEKK